MSLSGTKRTVSARDASGSERSRKLEQLFIDDRQRLAAVIDRLTCHLCAVLHDGFIRDQGKPILLLAAEVSLFALHSYHGSRYELYEAIVKLLSEHIAQLNVVDGEAAVKLYCFLRTVIDPHLKVVIGQLERTLFVSSIRTHDVMFSVCNMTMSLFTKLVVLSQLQRLVSSFVEVTSQTRLAFYAMLRQLRINYIFDYTLEDDQDAALETLLENARQWRRLSEDRRGQRRCMGEICIALETLSVPCEQLISLFDALWSPHALTRTVQTAIVNIIRP